jgi:hypothetical protein
MTSWPELPQLDRRPVDRCDVFPVALGVEAIYLNRRCSMKSMLYAAIGTAHSIDGRSYRPSPAKQQFCSARAIHHSLLWSWHQLRFAAQSRGYRTNSAVRRSLPESEVRAVLMVVANILREQSLEMAFIHRDTVVQEVSSASFGPTLRHTVLPGTLEGRGQGLSSGIERPPEPPSRISHPGRKSETWA